MNFTLRACCTSIIVCCFFLNNLKSEKSLAPALEAKRAFQAGKFEYAQQVYENMSAKSNDDWFYLGKCYSTQGNYAPALLCWERARKGASWHLLQAIRKELKTVTGSDGASAQGIRSWGAALIINAHDVVECMSPFLMQMLIISMWYFFLAITFFVPTSKKWRTIAQRLSCAFLLVAGSSLAVFMHEYGKQRAVVMAENAPLLVGPHERYTVLDRLAPATLVKINSQTKDWCKVAYGKRQGWMKMHDVSVV